MFECLELTVERNGLRLFQPFSLAIAPGEVWTLEGPSGLGKSTLLSALIGPCPGVSLCGEVRLSGRAWSEIPISAKRAQMVFQEPSLFPHLSIGANIALGLEGLTRQVKVERVRQLLAALGLEYPLEHPATALSRGEAMRVQIARAIAPEPQVLFLDEAFSALDPTRREAVRAYVFQWVRESGAMCLQVTHSGEDRADERRVECLMPV